MKPLTRTGFSYPFNQFDLVNHERVRLTVERPTGRSAVEDVRWWREHRIKADPQLAQEIALSAEFNIEES